MSKIAKLLRRTFGIVKVHVGTDKFGNNYFSVPEQKTWTGRVIQAKRMMEASNPTEFEYLEGSIPPEWDAWIRGRRKEPPSIEDMLKNELYREQIKLKVQELEKREQDQEGLAAHTLVQGHASATPFGPADISEEPVSTASTFTPGSWTPPGETNQKT